MSQLPEIIESLLDPAQYSEEKLDKVELIQTQMSFVLLTNRFAYKIRKPVNLGYVDYSTLEKRRFFSEKELKLNRRLCPDTYLELITVNNASGKISLGGTGEIIDYAVKMKRLPADGMMDQLLRRDQLTPDMLAAVARKLAEFHTAAETNQQINQFGSLNLISKNVAENFEQSRPYIGRALSEHQFEKLDKYFEHFLENNQSLFERRVYGGHIRDCHGDLHSAHVNFNKDAICVFDCIEFNDRFRYGDTASEVAFLAMDLDRHGRADLRRNFVAEYSRSSGDNGLADLLRFYQTYRAHIRAKVACFKLDDPFVPEAEKNTEREKAEGYFNLAVSYTMTRPQLFITSGLTGCGKSTLATELTHHLGLTHISSDIIRKKLAGLTPDDATGTDINSGIYTPEMTDKTYSALIDEAGRVLSQGDSVILDATFLKHADRKKALEMAQKYHTEPMVIECRLNKDINKKRLERRRYENTSSDGNWSVYLSQESLAEPVLELPIGRNHVIIDTQKPVIENLRFIISRLYGD